MVSRFVIAFLPRSNLVLISWLQSPFAVTVESKKKESVTAFICLEVIGLEVVTLVFWMLSFKPAFSLSSFTLIKSLFSFPLLSANQVVSSAYLRLLICLLAILTAACKSSCSAFCLTCSAYELNKQGNNKQSYYTPFPILNQMQPIKASKYKNILKLNLSHDRLTIKKGGINHDWGNNALLHPPM